MKLSDVPLAIRRRHGGSLKTRLMKDGEGGDVYRLMLVVSELETAIEKPSDRIHYVPRRAYEKAASKWRR